jgi:hypothetical protein
LKPFQIFALLFCQSFRRILLSFSVQFRLFFRPLLSSHPILLFLLLVRHPPLFLSFMGLSAHPTHTFIVGFLRAQATWVVRGKSFVPLRVLYGLRRSSRHISL